MLLYNLMPCQFVGTKYSCVPCESTIVIISMTGAAIFDANTIQQDKHEVCLNCCTNKNLSNIYWLEKININVGDH